jgi:hypothetical protein
MMSGMDQRPRKDVFVILVVIAVIVALAVLLTWTARDNVEAPLDTDPRTAPASVAPAGEAAWTS